MTLTEVLSDLKKLNNTDKIRAIQFLANEIAKEEEIWFEKSQEYEFFSLRNSGEAAHELMKLLEEKKADPSQNKFEIKTR